MRDDNEFKLVTHRKKRGPVRFKRDINIPFERDNYNDDVEESNGNGIDPETLLRNIDNAVIELKNSSYGDSVFRRMKETLDTLNVSSIAEIVCFGLGQFSLSKSSKYQLALLLSFKRQYGCKVCIYDPLFLKKEVELLERVDFEIIPINEEGKHVVDKNPTLVYMPHCSAHLTNNFLYANWGPKLSSCILLTNSFSSLTDDINRQRQPFCIDYLLRICPYVTEIALRNDFTFNEAFNDTSIHIFLERNINAVTQDLWAMREEPRYREAEEKAGMNLNVRLIRSVVQEIRRNSLMKNTKDNVMIRHVMEQARIHRETSEIVCKAREELRNLAETYLCYLNSRRVCREIQARYAGKGERSIKETADLVGFKLPHDPK